MGFNQKIFEVKLICHNFIFIPNYNMVSRKRKIQNKSPISSISSLKSQSKSSKRSYNSAPTSYENKITDCSESLSYKTATSKSIASNSAAKNCLKKKSNLPQSSVWENIVLYYLTKLKNAWGNFGNDHPVPGKRLNASKALKKIYKDQDIERRTRATTNVMKPMMPQPEKYSSLYPKDIEKSKTPPQSANIQKAYNIVAKALAYGYINGIVKKCGKYFFLLPKGKVPTAPVPLEPKQLCKTCRTSTRKNSNQNRENLDKKQFAENRSRSKKSKKPTLPKTLPKRKVSKRQNKDLY